MSLLLVAWADAALEDGTRGRVVRQWSSRYRTQRYAGTAVCVRLEEGHECDWEEEGPQWWLEQQGPEAGVAPVTADLLCYNGQCALFNVCIDTQDQDTEWKLVLTCACVRLKSDAFRALPRSAFKSSVAQHNQSALEAWRMGFLGPQGTPLPPPCIAKRRQRRSGSNASTSPSTPSSTSSSCCGSKRGTPSSVDAHRASPPLPPPRARRRRTSTASHSHHMLVTDHMEHSARRRSTAILGRVSTDMDSFWSTQVMSFEDWDTMAQPMFATSFPYVSSEYESTTTSTGSSGAPVPPAPCSPTFGAHEGVPFSPEMSIPLPSPTSLSSLLLHPIGAPPIHNPPHSPSPSPSPSAPDSSPALYKRVQVLLRRLLQISPSQVRVVLYDDDASSLRDCDPVLSAAQWSDISTLDRDVKRCVDIQLNYVYNPNSPSTSESASSTSLLSTTSTATATTTATTSATASPSSVSPASCSSSSSSSSSSSTSYVGDDVLMKHHLAFGCLLRILPSVLAFVARAYQEKRRVSQRRQSDVSQTVHLLEFALHQLVCMVHVQSCTLCVQWNSLALSFFNISTVLSQLLSEACVVMGSCGQGEAPGAPGAPEGEYRLRVHLPVRAHRKGDNKRGYHIVPAGSKGQGRGGGLLCSITSRSPVSRDHWLGLQWSVCSERSGFGVTSGRGQSYICATCLLALSPTCALFEVFFRVQNGVPFSFRVTPPNCPSPITDVDSLLLRVGETKLFKKYSNATQLKASSSPNASHNKVPLRHRKKLGPLADAIALASMRTAVHQWVTAYEQCFSSPQSHSPSSHDILSQLLSHRTL